MEKGTTDSFYTSTFRYMNHGKSYQYNTLDNQQPDLILGKWEGRKAVIGGVQCVCMVGETPWLGEVVSRRSHTRCWEDSGAATDLRGLGDFKYSIYITVH